MSAGLIASVVDNWPLIVSVAVVVVVAMLLVSRFAHRDPQTRRTRYGFFVERSRFEDNWVELHPPDERTLSQWPAVPPKEEK